MIKFVAIIAVLGLSIHMALSAPSHEKVDCSKLDETLEELGSAQGMTTLNDKYKLAIDENGYKARCKEMSDAILALKRVNKECFTSLTQQVFSAILRTRNEFNNLHCKPENPEYKVGLEASKCIQEQALEKSKDAEKKTILSSQVLFDANIQDEKLRLRRSCCAVLNSKNFFMAATKDKCAKYESTYSGYVDSYTSEAMGLICPEADKLECDKLETMKLDGVDLKSKFFLGPMLKLVKSLDH